MPRLLEDREHQFIKILNAKPTINSGATFSDGDAVMKTVLGDYNKIGVEIKCTDAKSYSIKKETWQKIKKISQQHMQMPLLAVDIAGERLIVLDANDFMSMISFIESMLTSEAEGEAKVWSLDGNHSTE